MAKWTAKDIPALAGKRAVVTGANSGLGLETAAELARAGADVVMACRDPGRASAAVAEVQRRAPDSRVEAMALDLADLSSVRAFAEGYMAKHARLDMLCNNAGVMHLPYQKTRDGFEMQVGTNHLGHFVLTGLLLDTLKATPKARIVTVASIAHRATKGIDLDDLNWERRPYSPADSYGKSKLANLMFHFELQRRLEKAGSDVLAVAAHPGYSATNIGFGLKDKTPLWKRWAMNIGNALFAQPASKGALPTLYAATMPDIVGGDYIGPDGFIEFMGHPTRVGSRPEARDPQLGQRLWQLSEQLTGLSYL
ncbi:SDR family NAD(P)-dependent oxidoreductase [Solimonas sp. K1W22B-7]|uniref:oxidoreductase n=1 Tax=Solimonas sp. K1W22B-7 TaxID=2303331 RepID=UPI000E332D7A|nr:oxidoreductase [Solimonas sp. K1W22B-7]AXQ30146.1 SDR family NAD(P)-dependent oxidoreductase [Solimonas sp. K1W22B-7]